MTYSARRVNKNVRLAFYSDSTLSHLLHLILIAVRCCSCSYYYKEDEGVIVSLK